MTLWKKYKVFLKKATFNTHSEDEVIHADIHLPFSLGGVDFLLEAREILWAGILRKKLGLYICSTNLKYYQSSSLTMAECIAIIFKCMLINKVIFF